MSVVDDLDSLSENSLFSSEHGWVETNRIQRVISAFQNPGLIYLPAGTWEESLIVTQHNLTILGEGKETVLKNVDQQSPISIIAPSIRIVNLTIESEYEVPAVSLTHGDATQTVLQNVVISESGSHGIYRAEEYPSAVGAILNCQFQSIREHAIYAPTGTGPQNLVWGNTGENIGGNFIRWGVDNSILAYNQCEDSPITLTEDAHQNLVLTDDDTEISSGWPEDNMVF